MPKPKRFDELVGKGIRLTPEQITKAERIGDGDFSEGMRRCLELYNEEYTQAYADEEIERLKSLVHCNELTHDKLIKDLARFEKHKHDAAKAISTVDDNKLAFLQKAKRSYLDIKLRVPDKAGFTFRGWLNGPANIERIKELWKNDKTAHDEIAKYLNDRTWLNTED